MYENYRNYTQFFEKVIWFMRPLANDPESADMLISQGVVLNWLE